jgi:hypothetical protein
MGTYYEGTTVYICGDHKFMQNEQSGSIWDMRVISK